MKNPLVKVVKDFLSSQYLPGKPILLGYSGGVDSTALFSILMECRPFFSFDLQIVHFDHAWREESLQEARELKEKAHNLNIPFHSKRSQEGFGQDSNKEEKAREERFLFFMEVYKKVGAQALILAHQREDLAETVLKRVCEGSGILSLSGMQPISLYEEIVLWRPLLFVSRQLLLKWNEEKKLIALMDYTNEDLRFLRPRMRQKVFPELEKWFGKGIQKNLALLGEEFALLKIHMEEKLLPFVSKKIEGPLGFALLSETFTPLDSFEKQELIRMAFQKKGIRVGREAVKLMVFLLDSHVSDKKVDVPRGELIIDKGSLFWLEDKEEKCWEIFSSPLVPSSTSLLESLLKGKIFYKVAKGDEVAFCEYAFLDSKEQKKIASFFSKNKIPATMRRFFPFLKKNGTLVDLSYLFYNDLFSADCEVILTIKLKNILN